MEFHFRQKKKQNRGEKREMGTRNPHGSFERRKIVVSPQIGKNQLRESDYSCLGNQFIDHKESSTIRFVHKDPSC